MNTEIKVKDVLLKNQSKLPILSMFWEVNLSTGSEDNMPENSISLAHNTSCYHSYSSFKTVSCTLNLKYFDSK